MPQDGHLAALQEHHRHCEASFLKGLHHFLGPEKAQTRKSLVGVFGEVLSCDDFHSPEEHLVEVRFVVGLMGEQECCPWLGHLGTVMKLGSGTKLVF